VGKHPHWPQTAPLYFAPGNAADWHPEGFGYSSVGFAHLGLVIRHMTGRRAADYLWERLFQPIGIEGFSTFAPPSRPFRADRLSWTYDPHTGGTHVWAVFGGLELTPRDYARFAFLLMHDGRWDGRQIVPAAWIRHFRTSDAYPNVRSNVDGYFDDRCDGTYPKDLFRLFGSGINVAYVVPSLDLIALRTGRGDNRARAEVERNLLRLLFASVLPEDRRHGQTR
jgi:CubicO group peptidase (beta-lactamase class C family)